MNEELRKPASLLRRFVEVPPSGLGISDDWTWKPNGSVDVTKLQAVSPTSEYQTESEDCF